MFFRFLIILFFSLFLSEAFAQDDIRNDSAEPADGIAEFKRKFLVRFLCNYNFVSLWSSEFSEGSLSSNRPVDVGLGFGYKDLYLDLMYSLPFTTSNGRSKSLAFETGLDFFRETGG